MTTKTLGWILAACTAALMISGCAQRVGGGQSIAGSPEIRKKVQGCEWTFGAFDAQGKVIADSLELTADTGKVCDKKTVPSATPFYFGEKNHEKQIIGIGAVEIITEGSYRYCYPNSQGGMTCICIGGPC